MTSKKENIEFNIQFCESNLRYLLNWQPESDKIAFMKDEIERLNKELRELVPLSRKEHEEALWG